MRSRTSRIAWILLASLALAFAGCGGGADDRNQAEGHDQHDSHTDGPGEVHAADDGPQQSPGDVAALMAEMPDPATQPLEHLIWRVDLMYENEDADTDGKLTREEYSGTTYNFQRLDADENGYITKQEIIDDQTVTLRERGRIP